MLQHLCQASWPTPHSEFRGNFSRGAALKRHANLERHARGKVLENKSAHRRDADRAPIEMSDEILAAVCSRLVKNLPREKICALDPMRSLAQDPQRFDRPPPARAKARLISLNSNTEIKGPPHAEIFCA
jgi:hypothetical protein